MASRSALPLPPAIQKQLISEGRDVEDIDFEGTDLERMTSSAYRERVEGRIRALVDDNPTLQKMLEGGDLAEDEIAELAALLEHDSLQIQFLRTLETFIAQTGRVARHDLIDAPFTLIHPQGIRGIFKPAGIDEILNFAEELVA